MTPQQLIEMHRGEILFAARKHGAGNVRLFGSVARGESDEQSDIDILVDLESGRSLFDLVRLQGEMERVLGRRVDLVTERGLRERIRARVLAEARPI